MKNLQNLKGAQTLSREEQRNIFGGAGGCQGSYTCVGGGRSGSGPVSGWDDLWSHAESQCGESGVSSAFMFGCDME